MAFHINALPGGRARFQPPGMHPMVLQQQPPPPEPPKRPWKTLGVLGAILLATAGVIWWRADD